MRIYVGGVNAVGKSTLLKKVSERLGYEYVHVTTGLMQHLGIPGDYEKLRALTQKERDDGLRQYLTELLQDEQKKDVILDTHYLCLVRGKIERVTDEWLRLADVLVLVSAPLDDVWNRIAADLKIRDRALFPAGVSEEEMKEMLALYQTQTHDEFKRLATLYAKPHSEIVNKQNKLEEAVGDFVGFVLSWGNSIQKIQ